MLAIWTFRNSQNGALQCICLPYGYRNVRRSWRTHDGDYVLLPSITRTRERKASERLESILPTANYVHSGTAKWRIAIHMLVIWMPQRTAAVANPRRRLCLDAINHPNPGAERLFIFAIKAPFIGTNSSFPLAGQKGGENLSLVQPQAYRNFYPENK